MAFVNPYTFIGFPQQVERRPPLGHTPSHEQAQQRYTGAISVTWRLRSPLAIPGDGSWGLGGDDETGHQAEGEVRIPGASVKGALRSVHEALFAGCARIIDPWFTPVYREYMAPALARGWTLGIVGTRDSDVKTANPHLQIMPCGDVGWTSGSALLERCRGELPRTGDMVTVAGKSAEYDRTTYSQVTGYHRIERGDQWWPQTKAAYQAGMSVILVTDTSARAGNNPYYWATAKPTGEWVPVPPEALRRFRQRLRGARTTESADHFEDVCWPPAPAHGTPVARRRTVDGFLRQGDVVWIKMSGDGIVDLKLSLGWRTPASGEHARLKDRIPRHVAPCQHLDEGLCLSCVVFGSIDADAQRGEGRQDSYGGHVRFGDATGVCSARRKVELAPLGSPRPGAGMYYLTPVSTEQMEDRKIRTQGTSATIPADLPGRWDSKAGESKGVRALRGRKFYWHSDPVTQQQAKNLPQPRYQRVLGVHTNTENVPTVHLVDEGELHQRITFDGLDAVALASLLASLNPGLLLGGTGDYGLHVGRGKPLGLGSVQAEITLEMTTTADRYSTAPTILTELENLQSILDQDVPGRCGDLTSVKAQARKVLDIGGLGDQANDVGYPTTEPWAHYGQDAFHESFKFFHEAGKVRWRPRAPKTAANAIREHWNPLPLITDRQGQGDPR